MDFHFPLDKECKYEKELLPQTAKEWHKKPPDVGRLGSTEGASSRLFHLILVITETRENDLGIFYLNPNVKF